MKRGKQTRGHCVFCGYESAKTAMIKHLGGCPQRQAQMVEAEKTKRNPETLWYLRVRDAYGGDFWLDLEVRGSSSLKDIDAYLRAIWLECCGHLSEFTTARWGGTKISMQRRVDAVFQPGLELTHIYDFGTPTETLVKALDSRVGVPLTAHPIFLMVRNEMPPMTCMECEEPATHFCLECSLEGDAGTLCEEHAASHPHVEDGEPFERVNSPRLGACGYEGPADPPY